MNPLFESNLLQTRRQFFGQSGLRLGGLGLTYLMGKDVLIRFEFSRELSNDEFDAIEPLFVTWNHLITHGGYGNDVGEVELDDAIVCGETYMAAPDTLEHEFVCAVAHVAAFEAVVNMAIGVHRRLCTLKRVEIT